MECSFYGKYRYVRDAAWQVLKDFGINTLPISTMKLAKLMGIQVRTYIDGKSIIELLEISHLCEHNNGFSAYIEAMNQWYIFFDESINPKTHIRFTIAHELGHIFLGHKSELKNGENNTGKYTDENTAKGRKSVIETEADMFALRLLAPACVLWGLNITEAEDIMTLCDITLEQAKIRAKRMEKLYLREKFLSDELEKQVYSLFSTFIDDFKKNYKKP